MDNSIKLFIKISTPTKPEPHWVHLCYVDRDLHKAYTEKFHHINNQSLTRWCEEDFGIHLPIQDLDDFLKLKTLVRGYYSEKYPEIYYESNTDHQGWLRLWVINKMKEEVYGKVCV